MMSELFDVQADGPITVITINRPEAMNALDAPRHFKMAEIIDAFAADPEQRVLIVTGAGDRAFCAGNDLKQKLGPNDPIVPPTGFGGLCGRAVLDKPVIAAVNGMAFGGGFEMALSCDLIVASENASFALPEARVGLAAIGGGLLRLPLQIGPKLTAELVMTGRRLSAQEGFDLGFVNRVTPVGGALDAALEMAQSIVLSAPLAIRAAKAVMRHGVEAAINAAFPLQMKLPEVAEMRASNDAKEGPRAFAEKRPPRWTGS